MYNPNDYWLWWLSLPLIYPPHNGMYPGPIYPPRPPMGPGPVFPPGQAPWPPMGPPRPMPRDEY